MIQKPRSAGDSIIRAPSALDPTSLPANTPAERSVKEGLVSVREMVENGWPALLAALSFLMGTNLGDEVFVDVLASYQALLNVAGMLGLSTPRDAFLTSLSKFAIPSRVVSSLESYVEPPTPRTASSFSEGLGALAGTVTGASGIGSGGTPGLSERNMACLKVLVQSGMFLAGSWGESWFDVLEALQNADYVLTAKGSRSAVVGIGAGVGTPSKRGHGSQKSVAQAGQAGVGGGSGGGAQGSQGHGQTVSRHPLLMDLDPESIQLAIQRLFDASKNLEDTAFRDFVNALCRLSSEMVGMQASQSQGDGLSSLSLSSFHSGSGIPENESLDDVTVSGSTVSLSTTLSQGQGQGPQTPRPEYTSRRRVSGIHLPRTLVRDSPLLLCF